MVPSLSVSDQRLQKTESCNIKPKPESLWFTLSGRPHHVIKQECDPVGAKQIYWVGGTTEKVGNNKIGKQLLGDHVWKPNKKPHKQNRK